MGPGLSSPAKLLALHGFGGTFGGTHDTILDIKSALATRSIAVEIVVPRAPNVTEHGEAWIAGDQTAWEKWLGLSSSRRNRLPAAHRSGRSKNQICRPVRHAAPLSTLTIYGTALLASIHRSQCWWTSGLLPLLLACHSMA